MEWIQCSLEKKLKLDFASYAMYDINSITYTLEIALTTQYGKISEKVL